MASKSTVPDLGQLSGGAEGAGRRAAVAAAGAENAALKDEVARLKGLNGRPKLRPSGMEPATAAAARGSRGKTRRRGRGAKTSRLAIGEERVLIRDSPFAGFRAG